MALVDLGNEPKTRPTPEDRNQLETLVEEYLEQLSSWEQSFLEQLDMQDRWSTAQCEQFDKLVNRKLNQ